MLKAAPRKNGELHPAREADSTTSLLALFLYHDPAQSFSRRAQLHAIAIVTVLGMGRVGEEVLKGGLHEQAM